MSCRFAAAQPRQEIGVLLLHRKLCNSTGTVALHALAALPDRCVQRILETSLLLVRQRYGLAAQTPRNRSMRFLARLRRSR